MTKVYRLESGITTTTEATKNFFTKAVLFTARKVEGGRIFFKDVNSSESLLTSPATVMRFMPHYGIVSTQNSIIPLWEVQNPRYSGEGEWRILCSATYKGYRYYVVDGPNNPCCYIDLTDTYWSGRYEELGYLGHCGLSWTPEYGKLKWSENELIGWDYGHCNDYVMYSDGLCSHGKKYTTSDLINDCIEAIDMLNDKEDEETLAYICD